MDVKKSVREFFQRLFGSSDSFLERLSVLQGEFLEALEAKDFQEEQRRLREHMATATDRDLHVLARQRYRNQAPSSRKQRDYPQIFEDLCEVREQCRKEAAQRANGG